MAQRYTYADLEIRIFRKQKKGYPVELTLNSEMEFKCGYLQPNLVSKIHDAPLSERGERLFELLFADDQLKEAWAEVRGQQPQRRVRLRIDAKAPELHEIPWELLREPGDDAAPSRDLAAAEATPFSRYLAGDWQPGSPIIKRPIKILVAIANPQNLGDFELPSIDEKAELTLLQEAVTDLCDVELVQLPGPCTLPAIEEELTKGYHILHFVGHGGYSERQGHAALYMANAENQVALAKDDDLAEMFARQLANTDVARDDKLRLVFLASCQTATRSPADAFQGLAPRLVAAGVPAVLAMQDSVLVDTAREFVQVFYRRLLQHGQVDLASNQARSALLTGELSGAHTPVLFMRLRSGELLGERGEIAGDTKGDFWPFLMRYIERKRCIPFLGPRVNDGLLLDPSSVAKKLARDYNYPMPDRSDLAKVAQFIDLRDPHTLREDYIHLLRDSLSDYLGIKLSKKDKEHLKGSNLTQTADELNWAEKVLNVHENEIHHLLAELELPLYITTNVDCFMVNALRHHGLDPRRIGPRWEQTEAGTPQYSLGQRLSPDGPLVFHLNGYDDEPEQLEHVILSEDNYLDHYLRLARDHTDVLPAEVITALAESSFLFIGYSLYDWELRVILRGLVHPLKARREQKGQRRVNVGVQLEADPELEEDKVIDYFQRYLGEYNIEVYWGTPRQFVTELHAEWQHFTGSYDEDEQEDQD